MPTKPKPWWRESRQAWFVQIDRVQHNLGPDKEAAYQKFYELMSQPKKRAPSADAVVEVVDLYLDWCEKHRAPDTFEWYRSRLELFCRSIPHQLSCSHLRPFHVQEWVDSRDSWEKGSKRNGIRAVQRSMRWAEEQGYIDHNPISHMKKPAQGKREVVISQSEYDTILGLANPSFSDLLSVTWETGCRPQESLVVEASNVDLAHQRWVFSDGKGGFLRVVYLTDEAFAITKRLMFQNKLGPLFRNSRGDTWTTDSVNCAFTRLQIKMGMENLKRPNVKDKRRRYDVDEKEVERLMDAMSGQTEAKKRHHARRKLAYGAAREAAPKYCLYTIRHSWATHALERGVDPLTVAILMGHQDPSTLSRVYQHLIVQRTLVIRWSARG